MMCSAYHVISMIEVPDGVYALMLIMGLSPRPESLTLVPMNNNLYV